MKSLVAMLAIGVLPACLQNPFGGDEISPPRSQLRGIVELNDGSNPVTVVFPELFESGVARVFVKKPGSKDVLIWTTGAYAIQHASSEQVVDRNPVSLTMRFSASLLDALAGGEYEIIPYVLVKYPQVPRNLLKTLAPNLEHDLKTYLDIPFSRKNARLVIEG